MKISRLLLAVLFAAFLTAVTVSAQDGAAPFEDSFAPDPFAPESPDPFAPPAPPAPPGGGFYKSGGVPPGGGYYKSGGGPPGGGPPGGGPPGGQPPGGGHTFPVPEPSTLILLGIGLAAGGVYSFVRRQKSRERV